MFVLCEDQYCPDLGYVETPADIIRQVFIRRVWSE
jgi:hypothetical protein